MRECRCLNASEFLGIRGGFGTSVNKDALAENLMIGSQQSGVQDPLLPLASHASLANVKNTKSNLRLLTDTKINHKSPPLGRTYQTGKRSKFIGTSLPCKTMIN